MLLIYKIGCNGFNLCITQVWNSVGLIRQYNTDEENSIDIEFHDTSTHHALHITNTMNHTMGDLSSEAAILACEREDDSPSRLVCMHFSSWDNVKEWSVSMPDDEEIMVYELDYFIFFHRVEDIMLHFS